MIASLSCLQKQFHSSTNLGSGRINCKMLPFELLYLLDFFVKPLKKISDTCCMGRVVEFLKNEWKQENLVLFIFSIFKYIPNYHVKLNEKISVYVSKYVSTYIQKFQAIVSQVQLGMLINAKGISNFLKKLLFLRNCQF